MAYRLKYKADWKNQRGHHYRIYIYQRDYTGSSKTIGFLSGCALQIQGDMGDVISPIIKTQLRFTIIDAPDEPARSGYKYGNWQEFFTPDATLYKVLLAEGGAGGAQYTDLWTGYITPDSWQEDLGYRGAITITARDNIGHLKDFQFKAEGRVAPDANGLVSLNNIIQGAFDVIEFPMSYAIESWAPGQYSHKVPVSQDGIYLEDAYLNAALFEGMNWYDVFEQTLEACGYAFRFVGGNRCDVGCLRSVPKLGETYEATGTQTLEFYGGTLELDPAVKRIEEEQDYKHKTDVDFEVFAGLQFNGTTTYRCKTDGNQLPGGGVVYVPEHDADMNTLSNKGKTGWDVGSGMLNPAGYSPDSFLKRAEGEDGWRNYAFVASNQVLNGSAPTATYRFATRTAAMKVTFRFTPSAATIENQGSAAGKMSVNSYALASVKYYVMFTDGTTTRYWNGGQWAAAAQLLEKEYDAQNAYETDLEINTGECTEIDAGTYVVRFGQIVYKMWYDGGHGCYARLAEIKAEIVSTTALKTNKVTTINSDAYNVMLKRKPLFGALSKEMSFVKPENYLAGMFFYRRYDSYPELLPYMMKFNNQTDDYLVPLPVLIHEQILCYYHGAARTLSGRCAPVNKARYDFKKLALYKGHKYLLQGGTLDLFSGIINSACFREYVDYEDLWGGGAPEYSEDVIYNS